MASLVSFFFRQLQSTPAFRIPRYFGYGEASEIEVPNVSFVAGADSGGGKFQQLGTFSFDYECEIDCTYDILIVMDLISYPCRSPAIKR